MHLIQPQIKLHEKFLLEAKVLPNSEGVVDPTKPFIYWEAMNRNPQREVAKLFNDIVMNRISLKSEESIHLLAIPDSASWLSEIFEEIEPLISIIPASKDIEKTRSWVSCQTLTVSPYVKGRMMGLENEVVPVYVDLSSVDESDHILLVDDVIAEGRTMANMAEQLTKLGFKHISVAAILAKRMQGGIELLSNNSNIREVIAGIILDKIELVNDNLRIMISSEN